MEEKTKENKLNEFLKEQKKALIFIAISLILLLLFSILKTIPYINEYVFARGISRGLLFIISRVTGFLPFSLTDWLYPLVILAAAFFLIYAIVLLFKKSFKKATKIFTVLIVVLLSFLLAFNLLFAFSYKRESALFHLNLVESEYDLSLASDSAVFYIERAKELESKFERDEKGGVISPYTFKELNDKINAEYDKLTDEYFSSFRTNGKKSLFGKGMSYLNLGGIYVPFLAESTVNVDMPDSSWGGTLAHELAHSRGVMRENEANFVSYYILIKSDDPYLNYLGLLDASAIMLNESYDQNDTSHYERAYAAFSDTMLREYANENEYWSDFDTIIDKIVSFINDKYLKSQGVPSGVKSYSETGKMLMSLYLELE